MFSKFPKVIYIYRLESSASSSSTSRENVLPDFSMRAIASRAQRSQAHEAIATLRTMKRRSPQG